MTNSQGLLFILRALLLFFETLLFVGQGTIEENK